MNVDVRERQPRQSEAHTTRMLASFAVGLRWEDIPPAVVHQAIRALIDYQGVALAGSQDEVTSKVLAVYPPHGGERQASLVGRPEKTDILEAALLNAVAGHALDYDDTHADFFYHATVPVAPAAWALGEHVRCSGPEFLTALIAGWDVGARIARALNPSIYLKGWQCTATVGTFASAVACAKLLKLDVDSTCNAIGIAAAQAGGTRQMLGTMSKPFQVGKASMNGLLSALLSREGLTSSPIALEAPLGFAALTAPQFDLDLAVEQLGTRFELLRNTFKPYPCCLKHHAVVDAFLALRRDHGVTPDTLASAECDCYPPLLDSANVDQPTTSSEGKFSVQHSAAVALSDAAAGLAQYTSGRVRDPDLAKLRGKLAFKADKRMGSGQCELTARCIDGTVLVVKIDGPRGSLANPLSDEELDAKFRDATHALRNTLGAERQDRTLAALRSLPDAKDLAAVVASF